MSDIKSPAPANSTSPFARSSQRYIDNGLPVIPIAPGTKMPGEYAAGRWRAMNGWQRWSTQLPSELVLNLWQAWPDAGIGLLLGPLAGIIAVDVDTEDEHLLAKINKFLPPSPVRKKGKKGWTSFYRYNGEINKSWRVKKQPVIDLLCDGRQTLMPGTIHPDGMTYVWITEDTLDSFDLSQLPTLPANFNDLMARMIEPLMDEDDRRHLKSGEGPKDITGDIPPPSFAAAYFRDINTQALHRLDEWVPRLIPTAKPNAQGYRCKAFWRHAENPNVGIARSGIRDFGGDYGLTPIDLVMYAQNVPFAQAAEALRAALNLAGEEAPALSVGKPKPAVKAAPLIVEAIGPKADDDPIMAAREAKLREERAKQQAEENAKEAPNFVLQAPGMIGRMAGWMAETAPKYQPELFVAAAVAAGAAAMGRLYRTNRANWPSLFVVMVAKSGEGKEHPQQCVSKILSAAGLDNLLAGAGYTSPGAVISTLLRAPSHIAIIDEIGKMLKLSRAQGASHSEGAIDKLVEVFGKSEDKLMSANYSTMSLSNKQLTGQGDRTVFNPAITLLGATTPDTFYQNLTRDLISDGFLGRVILVHSKRARQKTRPVDRTPPPDDVVDWIKAIADEAAGDLLTHMNPALPAKPVIMPISDEAQALFDLFDDELMELRDQFDGASLDTLLSRSLEKAIRVAMIAAKASNPPKDNIIRVEAAEWAIKWVRHYDLAAVKAIIEERSETLMQSLIKRAVRIIGAAKSYKHKQFQHVLKLGGMPHSKLSKDMGLSLREFKAMIDTAIDQGYITKTDGCPEAGFAGVVYWLRDDLEDDAEVN